jgi:probable HAF family extracellular repeat protein
MFMSQKVLRVLFAVLLGALIVPSLLAQVYTIRDLGPITPSALNNLGQVAGVDANNHAVLWSDGVVTELGLLPGGSYSVPTDINDFGVVVGGADSLVSYTDNSQTQTMTAQISFVWSKAAGLQTFGFLNYPSYPNRAYSYATSINNSNQILVSRGVRANDGMISFLSGSSGLVQLPTAGDTEALAINNLGKIVGWSGSAFNRDDCCSPAYGPRSSIWVSGQVVELGTLLPQSELTFYPKNYGVAGDINDMNQVVGWSQYVPTGVSPPIRRAYLWTQSDGMKDLGVLSGDVSSEAVKINSSGQVIGKSYSDPNATHAFFWTNAYGMRNLNDLNIRGRAGWQFVTATGINDAGQITGSGLLNGVARGYILTPHGKK